ncbi:MAG: hypothetical protein K9N51_04410 [Candidatus Pacebacteria bacterium]|nr:hypothetical protein [Candidatus Paceibacterota bacterium]
MNFRFFDGCFGIGRCNRQGSTAPTTVAEALAVMDQYDIAEALVYHYTARDCDPEVGNHALPEKLPSRLHRVWAIESAAVCPEPPATFVERALQQNVEAFLFSPMQTGFRLNESGRLAAIAACLAERKLPLLLTYRHINGGENLIDWADLTTFCRQHSNLRVLAGEWRTRVNRPLFDALAATTNLMISVSMLWQHRMIDQIVDAFGADRLFFSAGLPGLDPGSFQMPIAYAQISDNEKEAVAFTNLKNLLGEVTDE